MDYIWALIMGGVIGWVASIVMKTNEQQGIFLNIVVGVVGSMLGRLLFGWLFHGGRMRDGNAFDPMTLLSALAGAIVLLGVVNLVRRGNVR